MRHEHEHEHDSTTMDRSRRPDDRELRSGMSGRSEDRDRHGRANRSDDRHRWDNDRRPGSRDERDPRFGPDGYREGMPRNETEQLIASSKVEGTPVYDRNGRKLGTICTLMLDKRSGHTEYAVLKNSGGFLGINERYYPLDWRELTYDTRVHGYGVEFTEDQLDDRVGYDVGGRPLERRDGRRHGMHSDRW